MKKLKEVNDLVHNNSNILTLNEGGVYCPSVYEKKYKYNFKKLNYFLKNFLFIERVVDRLPIMT